jgi:hypothetical protein
MAYLILKKRKQLTKLLKFMPCSNYSGSREEVQLLADKSFGQPEKKLNFWLSSYALQVDVDSMITLALDQIR